MLESLIHKIEPVSTDVAARVQAALDNKTKPRGSLGRLEALACRYCAARASDAGLAPVKAVVVMAADHGVAAEGVSAFPQEVTAQMVANFAGGGAAINTLAQQVGAELLVVDMGVAHALPLPPEAGVRDCRVGAGTASMVHGPAMSEVQALAAIERGAAIAAELADGGTTVVGLGEMGIGNTTSASALTAVFTGVAVSDVTGRGTGIDDAALVNKIASIEAALKINAPDASKPLATLAALGGFEIAGLVGLVLGCAARRVAVVVDGFITVAAALTAVRLAPEAAGYLIGSHQSVEPGYVHAARALALEPLFDLQMRLGEGSGTPLAMAMLDSALAILRDMATFESAQVSDSGK